MLQFVGNIEAKMDTKNRVFLPAVFRKTLVAASQNSLILRKDIYQKCLILYPQEVWNNELTAIKQKLNRWDRQQSQLLRQFTVDAEIVDIDANGRILLPKRFLEMLSLDAELTFIGVDNTIEIWSKEELNNSLLPSDDFGNMLGDLMNT